MPSPNTSAAPTSEAAPTTAAAPAAVTSAAPPAEAAPSKPAAPVISNELLSLDWARRQARTDAQASAAAEHLRQQGYAAYRKKDDLKAVEHYEAALRLHATGRIYFDYANSLSNIPRFNDAVAAYQVAVELGFEHPELALYGVACAESRAQNADAAYAALDQAVGRGFVAFAKIQSDPDLTFLRARADWAERFARLSAGPALLVGTVGITDYRMDYRYTVCPDTTVRETSLAGMDGRSCCESMRYGKLLREGEEIVIRWNKVCGQTGIGKPDMSRGNPVCTPTKSCSARSCRAIDEKTHLLEAKDLQSSVNMPRPEGDANSGPETDVLYHRPFPNGAPPECSQTN
ncbi:MAG TPA: tetratricopeptide repeat protein [Polyangiaceae bacterium]|nr:tetratricopeptide repeat protein [Polyangiaceae bacterium]